MPRRHFRESGEEVFSTMGGGGETTWVVAVLATLLAACVTVGEGQQQLKNRTIATLAVAKDPKFIEEPGDLTARVGENVVLPCKVANRNGGRVQWTRDDFGLGQSRDTDFPRYTVIGNNMDSKPHSFIFVFILLILLSFPRMSNVVAAAALTRFITAHFCLSLHRILCLFFSILLDKQCLNDMILAVLIWC